MRSPGEFRHWSSPQTVADGHSYPSALTSQQEELYVGPTQSPRGSCGIELQLSITVTSVITHLLLAAFSSPSHISCASPSVFRDHLPNKLCVLQSLSQSLLLGKLKPRHSSRSAHENQVSSLSSGQQPGLVQDFAECWARDFSSGAGHF